jgi:peptidoglycan/xylan/chitin deacetylase (PgdA/CDA1 family)
LEYGQNIAEEEQVRVCSEGLDRVSGLLDRLGIVATFFTTANYARQRTEQIRALASRHEIASHGWFHNRFEEADLARSRTELAALVNKDVRGFRRAYMGHTDHGAVRRAGYDYNSSENPIWVPGRYNNLDKPRSAYIDQDLLNIPASATPLIRFPLFWLSFKNMPSFVIHAASMMILAADGYLCIYFHPWEFADLAPYRLPGYSRRPDGEALLGRLGRYLEWLKGRGEFSTMADFAAGYRSRASISARDLR